MTSRKLLPISKESSKNIGTNNEADFEDEDENLEGSPVDSDKKDSDPEGEDAYYVTFRNGIFALWIHKDIDVAHRYLKVFDALNNALDDIQEIHVHLNSNGGDCDTGIQLINALNRAKDKGIPVTAIVSCKAYSMAAMIALSVENLIMEPYSTLMLHDYSYSGAGKAGNQEAVAKVYKKIYRKLDRAILTGFLTPKEFAKMYDGADLYLTAEEVIDRLNNKA